jgi:hypothetical protein
VTAGSDGSIVVVGDPEPPPTTVVVEDADPEPGVVTEEPAPGAPSLVVVGDQPAGSTIPVDGSADVETDVTVLDTGQPGPPGRTGPPGPPWVDTGEWQPGTAYVAQSLVHFDGATWGTPIDLPPMAAFDSVYWRLWSSKGDQGERGEQGIQGEPGPFGAYQRDHYDVPMPSAVWTIQHNKHAILPVTVRDSTGRELRMVDLEYVDADTVQVRFGAPMSGSVEI